MTATSRSQIAGYGVYALANLAECGSPDNHESAGATFLKSVRDSVIERYRDDPGCSDWSDTIAEIADGAPDVYTYTLWAEFVDLAAYREDPSELGSDASDMEQCARVCLYMIAERLARALFDEISEITEDEEP